MENQKNSKALFILLVILVIILGILCILFATETISLNNKQNDNNSQNNNGNTQEQINTSNLSKICTAEVNEKLEILSMENKTEKIEAIGGSTKGYNVSTTVTKEHNHTSTPENNELYASDMLGTLYVLYKNKLYYTSQKETISKYCDSNKVNLKLTCDYSKFSDDVIKEFNTINLEVNIKAIGSYGNAGSGAPKPYAITTDGKVINIPDVALQNYNNCGIIYDNSEYPIDRMSL